MFAYSEYSKTKRPRVRGAVQFFLVVRGSVHRLKEFCFLSTHSPKRTSSTIRFGRLETKLPSIPQKCINFRHRKPRARNKFVHRYFAHMANSRFPFFQYDTPRLIFNAQLCGKTHDAEAQKKTHHVVINHRRQREHALWNDESFGTIHHIHEKKD